jgi:hypothetical protein
VGKQSLFAVRTVRNTQIHCGQSVPHRRHTDTLCGQGAECCNLRAVSVCSCHYTLKGWQWWYGWLILSSRQPFLAFAPWSGSGGCSTWAVSSRCRPSLLVFTLVPVWPYPLPALPSTRQSLDLLQSGPEDMFVHRKCRYPTQAAVVLLLSNICGICWVLIAVTWRRGAMLSTATPVNGHLFVSPRVVAMQRHDCLLQQISSLHCDDSKR